jgi:hypothetical protein
MGASWVCVIAGPLAPTEHVYSTGSLGAEPGERALGSGRFRSARDPSSGVIGARPLGVPGLRYPGAACDKRIGVEVRAAMLLVGRRKARFATEPARVLR